MTTSAPLRSALRVAVIDDERPFAESCATVLRFDGYEVSTWARPSEALDALGRRPFDILVTDLRLPQVGGMVLMRAALSTNPGCLVILTTDRPSLEESVDALAAGAWEYLPKPFSAAHLQFLVARASRAVEARRAAPASALPGLEDDDPFAILGNSPGLAAALDTALKVAPTDASVFITGESGSGKELVARYIHRHSRRADRTFVPLNCAALPEALLESEMFGHRKGAFTGAHRDKTGLLEAADNGTLFLDELGEMPLSVQAKLLRVIQDGVVRRVGSETAETVVDVRFISATNRDPQAVVAGGALREDLFYRLRVIPIHLPALRERAEDIPLLAEQFLRRSWLRHHRGSGECPQLTAAAIARLTLHPWRGNVRELQNVIEHLAVVAEPGSRIDASAIQFPDAPEGELHTPSVFGPALVGAYHQTRERVIAQFESDYFTALIERAAGNMSLAARLAGVDRTTLYRLVGRHKLPRQQRRSWPPGEIQTEVA